jgi:hypothetical protein
MGAICFCLAQLNDRPRSEISSSSTLLIASTMGDHFER